MPQTVQRETDLPRFPLFLSSATTRRDDDIDGGIVVVVTDKKEVLLLERQVFVNSRESQSEESKIFAQAGKVNATKKKFPRKKMSLREKEEECVG